MRHSTKKPNKVHTERISSGNNRGCKALECQKAGKQKREQGANSKTQKRKTKKKYEKKEKNKNTRLEDEGTQPKNDRRQTAGDPKKHASPHALRYACVKCISRLLSFSFSIFRPLRHATWQAAPRTTLQLPSRVLSAQWPPSEKRNEQATSTAAGSASTTLAWLQARPGHGWDRPVGTLKKRMRKKEEKSELTERGRACCLLHVQTPYEDTACTAGPCKKSHQS